MNWAEMGWTQWQTGARHSWLLWLLVGPKLEWQLECQKKRGAAVPTEVMVLPQMYRAGEDNLMMHLGLVLGGQNPGEETGTGLVEPMDQL